MDIRKSQVYHAVIIAQITYGMSTVHLTPAMLHRLAAIQMRGLRYILKIEHAYYSGTSNKEVYDKINIILNKGTDINITWQEKSSFRQAQQNKKNQRIYYAAAKQNTCTCH